MDFDELTKEHNFIRTVASGDICECPECNAHILIDADWEKSED